jgi:flagellar biosynthesis/type III secretory pathway protein FliH
MATRIIKQGAGRDSIVQRVSFLESSAELPGAGQSLWPELASVPSAKRTPSAAETSIPAAVDIAQLEKTAFENGLVQGERAGLEIAEEKAESVRKQFAETILEINKFRSLLYTQVERDVVKLAMDIARKIIHREIKEDPDYIRTMMHIALDRVAEKSAITIHLNPEDHSYLLEHHAESSYAEGQDITLLPDKSIGRGGCYIETGCGDIDARIEEKFQEVERVFSKA